MEIKPPASVICMGQVLTRLFPNVKIVKKIMMGKEFHCYQGVKLRCSLDESHRKIEMPEYVIWNIQKIQI